MPLWTEDDDAFLGVAPKATPNPANEAEWRKRLANQGELRAPPPKSLWRTFIDSFTPGQALEETMRRGPAGLIATYVAPLVETGDGKSYSERRKAFATKEKARRQNYDAVNAPKNAGEFIAELPASIVGSLISDPTNLVGGPAKTLGGKALTAAGVGGAADVALQGGEMVSGLRDEYNPLQTGINVAAGPAFVAAVHGAGKVAGRVQEHYNLKEAAKLGREFGRVTSLTRTPEHNKKVGGVPNSWHVKGRAMDIARAKGVSHADIVAEFKARGYNLIEALDEGDHTHLAFDFRKPAPGAAPKTAPETGQDVTSNGLLDGFVNDLQSKGYTQIGQKTGEFDGLDDNQFSGKIDKIADEFEAGKTHPDLKGEDYRFAEQYIDDIIDELERRKWMRDPANAEEIAKHTGDNVVQFPGQKRPPLTEDELGDILSKPGADDFADVLTPAERQDMDASVPAPPTVRGAMSEDIIDSVVGQGRAATTPVNDFHPQTPEDLRLQQLLDTPENASEAKRIWMEAHEQAIKKFRRPDDYVSGQMKQAGKSGRKFTATQEQMDEVLKAADNAVKGFWQTKLDEAKKLLKDIIDDEEGSYRPFGRDAGPDEPSDTSLLGRLTKALEDADSLKGEQAEMAHAHRAKQALKMENAAKSVRGRARLYAMRHAQKGEIDKPGFSPIEDKFSPEEIDTVSDYISEFTGWTSVHDSANALDGWNKLLKGVIPTNSELALLEKVLPRDAITAILKHMPRDKAELIVDALNIPRSVLSSFDISAPGRQGVFLVGRKEYWQGLPDMIRQFGSEEAHQAIQKAIRDDPDFHLAEKAGLATQDTQVRLGGKEENFNSNLAENYIPGVRMSDRSFSGYLHKLRFDVFKSIIDNHRELGVDVNNPKYLKSLGAYLNAATGRGDLPKLLERWAPAMNAMLFSPRLMASRLSLLNPVFYAKMHPKVRAEALKDLSRFTSVAGSILGVAALAGATISLDSNSSDFLKIKIGDRRYDVLGGFQQYMVLGSRIKEYLAGQFGLQEKKKGLEQTNLQNAPTRFARTKLAPIPSAIIDSWLGKDVVGQDTNLIKEAFGLVTPMSAGDIAEAAYDDGLLEGALALPSLGGIGYAKYQEKVNKKDRDKEFLGVDTNKDEEFLSPQDKDEEWLSK